MSQCPTREKNSSPLCSSRRTATCSTSTKLGEELSEHTAAFGPFSVRRLPTAHILHITIYEMKKCEKGRRVFSLSLCSKSINKKKFKTKMQFFALTICTFSHSLAAPLSPKEKKVGLGIVSPNSWIYVKNFIHAYRPCLPFLEATFPAY